jgi:hypothetical protein
MGIFYVRGQTSVHRTDKTQKTTFTFLKENETFKD